MILLPPDDFARHLSLLRQVPINHLFALAVLRRQVDGWVWADHPDHPQALYLLHPYSMSLLVGETDHPAFLEALRKHCLGSSSSRQGPEWLQTYPESWAPKLADWLGDALLDRQGLSTPVGPNPRVEVYTRVNFQFNPAAYAAFRTTLPACPFPIVPTGPQYFHDLPGSVVPRFFWRDAAQFAGQGIGFSALDGTIAAATAFSAFVEEGQLEIGIETDERYRHRGLAAQVCCALIDYCLERNLEPIWSCRRENAASFRLACKLGFVPLRYLPYYRLASQV